MVEPMESGMTEHGLVGDWRLRSLRFEFTDDERQVDMYGADPVGFLVIGREGRMMTIITARDRQGSDAAGLLQGMMAYSGRYRVEGTDRFVTLVDAAWHPSWVGTEQARTFRVDAGVLFITTDELSHPRFPGRRGRGILIWDREA